MVLGAKKKKRFDEILTKLYENKDTDEKSVKRTKVGNKKQELTQERKKDKELFTKRVVFVSWKHRNDLDSEYECLGTVLAPRIKIPLNDYTNYSVQDLIEIFLEIYIFEKNKLFFDDSEIKIGTFDGCIIDSFSCENKENNFWEYVKAHNIRSKNHELNLYLLTTKKKPGMKTDELASLPSHPSLLRDQRHLHLKMNSVHSESPTPIKEASYPEKLKKRERALREIFKVPSAHSSILLNQQHSNVKDSSNLDKLKRKSLQLLQENVELPIEHTSSSVQVSRLQMNSDIPSISSPNFSELATISTQQEEIMKKSMFDSIDSELPSPRPGTEHYLNVSIQMIKEKDFKFSNIVLGSGAQGCVRKGKYLGSIVAIKSMLKGKNDRLILREIMLLDKIRHPNIISIIAACEGLTQFHIVMEYFKSESLFQIIFDKNIKNKYLLTREMKSKLCYQICCALAFLHLQPIPIIHRDIKPNNILVNDILHVKLCDLGLGKSKSVNESLQSTQADTIRGTYLFMAPEILLHRCEASTASDIWAFACTVIELYSEKSVWDAGNFFNAWSCAKENLDNRNVPNMDLVPSYIRPTLYKCFEYDPTKRPAIMELLDLFIENEDKCDSSKL